MEDLSRPVRRRRSRWERVDWRRHKSRLVTAGAAIIIVVALAIGLGVALTRKHRHGQTTPGSNRTSIWKPAVGESWQIVLQDPIKADEARSAMPEVQVFDLDMFENPADTFAMLRKAGSYVICYFSAGSYEDWRPDKSHFDATDIGKPLADWQGERWLDVSSPRVRRIMKARIKLAASKGCDAIDPDNVDGYQHDTGFDITKKASIEYIKLLSQEAAAWNMTTGLKNAAELIDHVLDAVDFSVNEQCIQYAECQPFSAFIRAKKPVFNIEYLAGTGSTISAEVQDSICSHKGNASYTEGFSIVIKKLNLDGWARYCN